MPPKHPDVAPELARIGLMLPLRGARPFTSVEWSFDMPQHGHRVLSEACAEGGRLLAASGLDISHRFPEVIQALAAELPAGRHVFDAELCVMEPCGRNDVRRLHERALSREPDPAWRVTLVRHDVLVYDGVDLRPMPWAHRSRALKRLPLKPQGIIQRQRTLPHQGEWLYRQAWALGRGALHARRLDAPYVAGRSDAWLAIPCAAPS